MCVGNGMKPTMAQLEQSFEATSYRSRSHRVRSLVKSNEEHRVVRVWNPFSWLQAQIRGRPQRLLWLRPPRRE